MVDLGFLLITFFIFTTALTKPTVLGLKLPQDVPDRDMQNIPVSGALTIMLGGNDKVYYYEGDDPAKLKGTSYKEIRDIISGKKKRTRPKDFMVILKPCKDATYKNTINILDEMNIDEVKRYAMIDIIPYEYSLMKKNQ